MTAMTIVQNSIVIGVLFNEQEIPCILDTGDAIGPVFNMDDAETLGLKPTGTIGVTGAGGATTNYTTVVDVEIDGYKWEGEPAAIDDNLQGMSLIGLPFFLKNCDTLLMEFKAGKVVLSRK